MTTPQENEFNILGIVSNKLRRGLVLGLLSLSITGNIIQAIYTNRAKDQLWEKMLNRADAAARDQANKTLFEPVKKIKRVTDRADTAISASIDAAKTADSVGKLILNNQIKK